MSEHQREDEHLVELARLLAVVKRHPPAGLLHHSDRGSECTSDRYLTLEASLGIEVSRENMEPDRHLL